MKARFLASPFARSLDDPDFPDLLDSLLWFASGYGPGDPLRWSPVAVEILLVDWIPRKIVADVAFLSKAPKLLRGFVAFCHDERKIRAELRDETQRAIDRFEPEYQRAIRSPRPQGLDALLAAFGPRDPEGWFAPTAEPEAEYWDIMLDSLREAVGGEEALAVLEDAPLADEPFDWQGVAEDVRPRVDEVLALTDKCCDSLLDPEFRTACRRLLGLVARGDPTVFRRQARADTAAAALCWIVGKDNDLFQPSRGGLLVKDLMAYFGIQQGSVSQRSATLLRAAGLRDGYGGYVRLGLPALLVSTRRRRIIELRDRYRVIAAEHA